MILSDEEMAICSCMMKVRLSLKFKRPLGFLRSTALGNNAECVCLPFHVFWCNFVCAVIHWSQHVQSLPNCRRECKKWQRRTRGRQTPTRSSVKLYWSSLMLLTTCSTSSRSGCVFSPLLSAFRNAQALNWRVQGLVDGSWSTNMEMQKALAAQWAHRIREGHAHVDKLSLFRDIWMDEGS